MAFSHATHIDRSGPRQNNNCLLHTHMTVQVYVRTATVIKQLIYAPSLDDVRTEQTGLLQRYTNWFAKIHDCTISTCSERCSETDRTCRSSRPRYKYAATITLASGAIPHHL